MSDVLVISRKGKVLGIKNREDVDSLHELIVDEVGGKYLVDNSVLVVLVELFKSVYEETEGGEYEDTVSTALLHLCGNIEHGIARRDHIVNEDKVHTGNVLTEEFVSNDGVSAVDDGRIVTSLVEHTEIET